MTTMTHPANGANPAAPTEKEKRPLQRLSDMLHAHKGQIALALPKHLTPERMIRVALTAFSKTPQLQDCTINSIVASVVQASELGLELNGVLGHAYLVPYWNKNIGANEAQFQVGYRGLLALAHRSGLVKSFYAHEVCDKDVFSFTYGTDPHIKHQPATGDRGVPVYYYAVCIQKAGGIDFEVMSKTDIDKHRDRYSKAKRSDSPWVTAYSEMAKKTVIRRLAKRVPLSAELTQAAVIDETVEARLSVADIVSSTAGMPMLPVGKSRIADVGQADGDGGQATPEDPPQASPDERSSSEGDQADLEADATFGELSEMVRQAETAKARGEARTAIAAAEDKIGSLRMTQLIDTLDAGAKKKSK